MKALPDFLTAVHDETDPNPWLALYLDRSVPISEAVKRAWLAGSSSKSRQFLLPIVRPFARALIALIQLVKVVVPQRLTSSRILHGVLAWSLKTWVSPQANWLILRHFHIGSEILDFIARNIEGVGVPLKPLRPRNLDDLRDHLFVKHDLNLYNFVINLNRELRNKGLEITAPERLDFSGVTAGEFPLDEMPFRRTNCIDLETAIELFTPVYQLFLTDNDFWRATNSLQLDETIGLYAAKLLGQPHNLLLINNKHPMVAISTLRAGHRLVLHGLASEMLHAVLVEAKRRQSGVNAGKNGGARCGSSG